MYNTKYSKPLNIFGKSIIIVTNAFADYNSSTFANIIWKHACAKQQEGYSLCEILGMLFTNSHSFSLIFFRNKTLII
jgi:hypothetical protein